MSTDLKISQLTPATTVNTNDYTVMVDGNTSANKRATVAQILAIAGAGTVTSINVSGANGINSSGGPITSSGTIALSLGAITPTSIVASGTISGSNLSNSNTGDQAITIVGDVTAPASTGTLTATLANSVVTNDKLADMVGPTVKGRTSGTGIPQDLSTAQVTAMLPEMVADSGTGGSKGLVPPPTAGSAAAKKFLRADATWVATDLNDILPSQGGNSGKVLQTSGTTTSWQAVGVGSVTNVSVVSSGGVSGSVATSTTTPAITLTLGAITPTSVNSVVVSGTSTPTLAVTGTSSISGSNTGDQTLNSLLPSQVGAAGKNLQSDGTNVSFVADAGGTVTSVSVNTANGVSGSVATSTTTPAISLTLGAITPTSVAATGAVTGSNLSGTNTGDQTITLTGGVTGSGTGSFAATVVTNANLTGDVTSSGNATTLTNAPVIAKVLTGYTSGAGTVAATDSILQAIQKLNGNDATNADLTGVITSVGNATSIASQTGTGSTFVVSSSPTITTPVISQINDASGNETLKLASIASAVNELSIENAATGNPVHIRATGGDASVGLHLVAKGASGFVNITDGVDETKRIMFNAAGGTTNTRTMLSSTQTVDRTISLPDATGTLLYDGGPLGTPASGTVTNLSGTASININGTVGGVTRNTGLFTSINTNGLISSTGDAQFGSASKMLYLRTLSGSNRIDSYDNPITAPVPLIINASTYTFQVSDVATGTLTSTGLNSIAIGATTPSTGAFSTLSATGNLTLSTGLISSGQITGSVTGPVAVYDIIPATGNTRLISFGKDNSTNGFFTVSSARANGSNNIDVASFTSTGAAITGTLSCTTGANFATSSGNVGVGTASPAFKTEIQQAVAGTAPSLRLTPQLVLKGYNGNSSFHSGIGFSMNEHTNGYWGSGILEVDDSGSYGAALAFYTSTGAALASPSEAMRISSSGTVGIGKTSPNGTLQVSTGTNFTSILKVSDTSSGGTGFILLGDGNSTDKAVGIWRADANSVSTGGSFLNIGGYGGIVFAASNALFGSQTERMRISAAGAVSITGTLSATGAATFSTTLATVKKSSDVSITNARNDNVACSANTSYVRLSGGGAVAQISGIVAGVDGQRLVIANVTGAGFTFLAEDTNSTAANRIFTPGLAASVLNNLGSREFIYDATASRWILIGNA